MIPNKKLIEVALPLEAINEASAYEKSIRGGHPSTLHLWWARRPLASARAVIFSSLVDDPDSPDAPADFVRACRNLPKGKNASEEDTPRKRLFDFIENLVSWKNSSSEEILATARELISLSTNGEIPPFLDPFAGGGSIPLEAHRLGLQTYASDLNPIPVIINKALIEIPSRFSNFTPVNPQDRKKIGGRVGWSAARGLQADVSFYGEWMRSEAYERIGHLYPDCNGETVIAWLWARTVKSPNPALDIHVPLIKNFRLNKKKNNSAWIKPEIDIDTKEVTFSVGRGDQGIPNPTVERSGGRCIVSDVPIPFDYIQAEGQAKRIKSTMLVICTEGDRKRNYYSPDPTHLAAAASAVPDWYPDYEMSTHPQYMAPPRYGMTTFGDIFTLRQLVALNTFSDLVTEVKNKVIRDALEAGMLDDETPLRDGGHGAVAYAEAVCIYLAFVVDKFADMNNALCVWKLDRECPVHLFGRQAIPITWDYVEANPFSASSGSWNSTLTNLVRSMTNDCLPAVPGTHKVVQSDARNANGIVHHPIICTDPPYYDNVPYADLSDFFYIWLRRSIKDIYPDIFGTLLVPKNSELVADNNRHNSRDEAKRYFEAGLMDVFRSLHHSMNPSFPLTVYYAFKQTDDIAASEEDDEINDNESVSSGWETILHALISVGFQISGTWPIRTEQRNRLRAVEANVLASSIILVCRPRPEDAPSTSRRAFLDDLRRELPAALKEMQSGNIAPVDLAQASIGPGMAIYSRYSKVLEADGSPMSVRTALGLINAALDEYLAEQDGDIDPDTRFAVDWFTQFGFNEGEFGQADVLARAKNTSVAGVESAGLVLSGRGKVKLKHWSEYDPGAWDPTQDKRPTVWEATHHLIERLNSHGETGSAMLMQKMPSDMAAEARQLAYRLYSICERKGWADHARDYNALVISWSGIGEEAARLRDAVARGDATTQLNLFDDEA